jgi:propanol-preferring alcohol dehydrogenase
MRAMVMQKPGQRLGLREVPEPQPGPGQVLLRVAACAVCRTDLHVLDGELPDPKLPLILGHEIVGRVVALGASVTGLGIRERVGIPWLAWTCGECGFCRTSQENLCARARFTGYMSDGGYAELTVADARFCFPLAEGMDDVSAAPLLCAGLIGYRALRKAREARNLGIYGFGAAAHLVTQVARHQGRAVFAFTRAGDPAAQQFALRLGAAWAGGSDEVTTQVPQSEPRNTRNTRTARTRRPVHSGHFSRLSYVSRLSPPEQLPDEKPPEPLDAAIIFAPIGGLVPAALRAVRKGGVVVCGGIHMSDIPSFP